MQRLTLRLIRLTVQHWKIAHSAESYIIIWSKFRASLIDDIAEIGKLFS